MPALSTRLKRWLPFAEKGAWTVLDQGLFAGSNFLLNILLARWLAPEAFGAFTVGFTVFLLLGMVQSGLFNEPILVFGPGRFADRQQPYLRAVVQGHGLFSLVGLVVTLVIGMVVWQVGSPMVGATLIALAAAQPFILLLWLTRQTCYVRSKPRWAAMGGFVYATLLISGSFALSALGWLSAASALGLMAFTSVVASALVLRKHGLNPFEKTDPALARDVRRAHWTYGRWSSATGVVKWLPSYLAYLVLPFALSLAASAEYKALVNLVLPILHATTALCTLLLPTFVRARDTSDFGRRARWAFATAFGLAGVYWLALGLTGPYFTHVLYDGKYDHVAYLLWFVGAIPFLEVGAALLRTLLRALERPDLVFWPYLASAVLSVTLNIWLIYAYGLMGAIAGVVAVTVLESSVMAVLLRRTRQRTARVVALNTRRAA